MLSSLLFLVVSKGSSPVPLVLANVNDQVGVCQQTSFDSPRTISFPGRIDDMGYLVTLQFGSDLSEDEKRGLLPAAENSEKGTKNTLGLAGPTDHAYSFNVTGEQLKNLRVNIPRSCHISVRTVNDSGAPGDWHAFLIPKGTSNYQVKMSVAQNTTSPLFASSPNIFYAWSQKAGESSQKLKNSNISLSIENVNNVSADDLKVWPVQFKGKDVGVLYNVSKKGENPKFVDIRNRWVEAGRTRELVYSEGADGKGELSVHVPAFAESGVDTSKSASIEIVDVSWIAKQEVSFLVDNKPATETKPVLGQSIRATLESLPTNGFKYFSLKKGGAAADAQVTDLEDGWEINAKKAGSISLAVESVFPDVQPKLATFGASILPLPTRFKFEYASGGTDAQLLPGNRIIMYVVALDLAPGTESRTKIRAIQARAKSGTADVQAQQDGSISITPQAGSEGTAIVIEADLEITVDGTAVGTGQVRVEHEIFIRQVIGFKPIDVILSPIQSQMVRDLFGKGFEEEFHVYSVRITNNLRNDAGLLLQKSIIAYSGSLQTGVTLEARLSDDEYKKQLRQANSDSAKKQEIEKLRNWEEVKMGQKDAFPDLLRAPLTVRRLTQSSGLDPQQATILKGSSIEFDIISEPGTRLENVTVMAERIDGTVCSGQELSLRRVSPNNWRVAFYFTQDGDFKIAAQGITRIVNRADGNKKATEKSAKKDDGDPDLPQAEAAEPEPDKFHASAFVIVKNSDDMPRIFSYRPYRFEFVEGASAALFQRSPSQRGQQIVGFLGKLATSLYTMFGEIESAGAKLAIFESAAPQLVSQMFPDMTDLQRSNLARMMMRPMEEVAFGSDLERIVFYPKGSFESVVGGRQTRIRTVIPDSFSIEIAVIDTKRTQSGGTKSTGNGTDSGGG